MKGIDRRLFLQSAIGNEAFVDGQKRRELEYTFYGRLEDFSALDGASKVEEQDQFHIPLDSDHIGMRIRRINGSKCVLTVKARREGAKGKEEVETEISEDTFLLLKESAASGFKKKRYYFPIEGSDLVWEIDVFEDLSGGRHSWVKLDMEVPEEETQLPPLPFALAEKIVAQGDRKTDQEQDFLDRLWGTEWNIASDDTTIIHADGPKSEGDESEEEEEQDRALSDT